MELIAPYAWLSGGELPSQRLRSHTFGLATAIGFLAAVSNPTPLSPPKFPFPSSPVDVVRVGQRKLTRVRTSVVAYDLLGALLH